VRWHNADLHSPAFLQVDGEPTEATHASLAVDPSAITITRA